MTPAPRGRSARFAFDPKVVLSFYQARINAFDSKHSARERANFVYRARHRPTLCRPAVTKFLGREGFTERQLKDFARKRGMNAVLWDRTKEA